MMPIIMGHCAHEALPHIFSISVFNSGEKISATIKHIYNESGNLTDGYNVASDTNDWWNFP